MSEIKTRSILGYQLKELLGSGGYGEVWSAEAPGGLLKAVKLVYGFHDDHRAQTELKALQRIKEIRHPFLLSLERIDVVDGQLVIVSELADCCLADLHQKYVREGCEGIPREILLPFIRDAAEALDYLATKHSLQHLDVKPDNLLVIGDHVKLADFGLVKDINQTQQSLVTGLTPVYAAPEIFDGRPGSKSDQYSLAVVYQEMLTSTRPFSGESSAQLAVQHLNQKPDLSQLPKSDQPLLAKALSKDPRNRFSSCLEFCSELNNRKLRKKTVHGIQVRRPEVRVADVTRVLPISRQDQTEIVTDTYSPFQEQSIEKLGPPEFSDNANWMQPTLIVGIGGMATQTVQQLKSRIVGRHGDVRQLPAMAMVCMDTDARTFDGLRPAEPEGRLSEKESLCLPLKSPEYYRNWSANSLNWLSRRWIYNIPKSLQTEGIRPLGRLAFADHFDKVCDSLREALCEITRPENIAVMSETLEATPADKIQPRVIVICSMNGGASGMLFDVGYLLRTLLIEEGFESEHVIGLLCHSIGSRANKAELSVANSLATFSELRHFVDCGYPGDESLGLPAFEDQPFGNVYFHDLGEESRNSDLRKQVRDVSEWLYLNCFANSARFFDACRNSSEQSDQFDLRTFGMKIHGPAEGQGPLNLASQMVSDLLFKWVNEVDSETEPADAQVLSEDDFDLDRLADRVEQAISASEYSQQFLDIRQRAADCVDRSHDVTTDLTELYDQVFGMPASLRPINYRQTALEADVEKSLRQTACEIGRQLSQSFTELFDRGKLRMEYTKTHVGKYQAGAENACEKLKERMAECSQEAERVLRALAAGRPEKNSDFDRDACLQAYHELRRKKFIYSHCLIPVRAMSEAALEFLGLLANGVRNLNAIREQFCNHLVNESDDEVEFSLAREVMAYVAGSESERMRLFEAEIQRDFVQRHVPFSDLLKEPHLIQRTLPGVLRLYSIRFAAEALRRVSIDRIVAARQLPPEQFISWINEQLTASLPEARTAGGNVRLLLGTPERSSDQLIRSIVSRYFRFESSSIPSTCGDLVFCFEGDGVSLAALAARLASERPRVMELSSRLHCRQDIQWSRIHELF